MNEFDIPIFQHSYDLYKQMHLLRSKITKQDRFTLWQRVENVTLTIIEDLLNAGSIPKADKLPVLESVSKNLNLLRVLLRLAKDTKTIDIKRYDQMQSAIDEIGRMLGGWIKQVKQ